MSASKRVKVTVYPSRSSCLSSTGPCCSTWAALSLDTFGISDSLRSIGPSIPGSARQFMRRSPHLSGRLEQPVLDRKQTCPGARGGIDLRIDVLHVVADRLGRDHKRRGDLLVR